MLALIFTQIMLQVLLDLALGNEITKTSLTSLVMGVAGYLLAYLIWWKTKLNALIPISVASFVLIFFHTYYRDIANMIAIGLYVPMVGSLLLIAIMRSLFRIKLGRKNWFERNQM